MNSMNQYRYNNVNKSNNTKLKRTAYQLGVVLIMLLVLMLIKYTKNQIGTSINEKIKVVFYEDYTEKTQSVFSNLSPVINNFINKTESPGDALEEANDDFEIAALPVNGEITSEFGTRIHPITKKEETHTGVDIAVAEGTEVKAAYDGIVEEIKDDEILGIVIVINHENGFKTSYGHLSEIKVSKGDRITGNSIIGLSGSTGISTGPHLHFAVMFNDEFIDPTSIVKTITN